MTNEKTDKRIELEAEAKSLGIKGRLPMQDSMLIAKIDNAKQKLAEEAEVVEDIVAIAEPEAVSATEIEEVAEVVETSAKPVRKVAPRMSVSGINSDERTKTIQRLEREDPDCKYVFQDAGISDADLLAKGLERVGITVKNDHLCRTQKAGYVEVQEEKNQARYEAMQRIDGGTGIVGSLDANPKTPKDKS